LAALDAEIHAALEKNADAYRSGLKTHFGRHLALLQSTLSGD
jgi:hypothetical protein